MYVLIDERRQKKGVDGCIMGRAQARRLALRLL